MKTNVLPIQRRLRTLALAAVAITVFALPTTFAFARGSHGGGHGGGGHGGGYGASHGGAMHSGFRLGGVHSTGTSHGGFARSARGQFANSVRHDITYGRGVRSVGSSSRGQLARRASQRFGNLNHHFVTGHHHHHHHVFFGFGSFYSPFFYGCPYYYGPYYPCDPYTDPNCY